MRRIVIGLGALVLVVSSQARAERAVPRGEKTFLWKATSDTTTVYLLGSVHMAKAELYPLAREIEEAFERSKFLVVEADEGKMEVAKIQQLVLEKGLYPAGESLSTKLSKEKLKNVEALVEKIGLKMEQADRMRPWFLSMTASFLSMQKLGYDPKLGIDRHFIQAAKEKGKEVKELESVEFQINLLAGFSDELQDLFVASTLEEIDGVEKRMEKIFEAWKKGDDKELTRMMITEGLARKPEMAPLQKKMLDDRNDGMVKKCEEYLKTRDVYFVVAGAAHMIGDKGICEQLRKKGYKVEQVEKG